MVEVWYKDFGSKKEYPKFKKKTFKLNLWATSEIQNNSKSIF